MVNVRFFVDYLLHYLKSNSRHGTHSPFVYQLVDSVIYDFSEKDYFVPIEALRKDLKNDDRLLRVDRLIARLAADVQPATVVELGTCLGIRSLYLSKASPASTLISVEGCLETAAIASENFRKLGSSVDLRIGNFDRILPEIVDELPRVDFLFIDGNHTQGATLRYFHTALKKIHAGSILIFDGIYRSKGMKESWTEIKAHPEVTVSIDLFYIGLVFFKKDQEKEDFSIRFR